jgi:hypothetical protein
MTKENFVTEINTLRRDNKNEWYFWNGKVCNSNVRLKGYNTWIQRIEVNGIKGGSPMEMKVKDFKNWLLNLNIA